jgi:hypothetical protein
MLTFTVTQSQFESVLSSLPAKGITVLPLTPLSGTAKYNGVAIRYEFSPASQIPDHGTLHLAVTNRPMLVTVAQVEARLLTLFTALVNNRVEGTGGESQS